MLTPYKETIIYAPGDDLAKLWCVYEHWMPMADAAPPELVYIAACKLVDVYRMSDARMNSEWTKLAAGNRPVMVKIIATTTDRVEALNHAIRHTRSFNPMPRCNLHGFNMNQSSRALLCSNGQEYPNQSEAARALGVSQGAISIHLKGGLNAVKGYTFVYKDVSR